MKYTQNSKETTEHKENIEIFSCGDDQVGRIGCLAINLVNQILLASPAIEESLGNLCLFGTWRECLVKT
jgi:hypothetical protein